MPLGPPDTVTMHLLSPTEPAPATAALPASSAAASSAAPTAAATADRWTVRPGECFWTIAESVLTQAGGRPPTDGEIVPYWQRLIAANRAELAHPENPDLIFPGQVFQVPAP
jgi:nucleoid-associated protein YgaU